MPGSFLVIGSNSFSGAHFVDFLLDRGHRVLGMSRSPEPAPVFLPYKQNPAQENFRFHRLDLNDDLTAMMAVIERERPPYVVNFAAQSMVAQSWEHPEHWFNTNVVSTVLLHDQLRRCDWLKRYVHISTPEVYGSCEGLIPESTIYNPSTPYAVSRAAADMSLMSFHQAYGFPVVFTRAANVFGPGQQLYRIVPITILNFLMGEKLQLHGGGHSIRSFIHIRDVACGTYLAALHGTPPDIFHLSTARQISIRKLVELIADRLGVYFEDHVEVTDDRLGKDSAYLLDCAKAREQLGWRDEITLEAGVDETIAWVRTNLDILRAFPRKYTHKP